MSTGAQFVIAAILALAFLSGACIGASLALRWASRQLRELRAEVDALFQDSPNA